MSAASETAALLCRRIAQVSEFAPGSIGDMLHFELLECDPEAGDYFLSCRTETWMRNPAGTRRDGAGSGDGTDPLLPENRSRDCAHRAAQRELPSPSESGGRGHNQGACGFHIQKPDNPVGRGPVKGKPGKAMPVRYGSVPLEIGAMRSLRRHREKNNKKGKIMVAFFEKVC